MILRQLLVEAYGCTGPLDDGPALCDALRQAAAAVGATVVREATHAYAPHGVTAMIFLAESHLMLTTWPEHGYAVAELFLCNEQMDAQLAWRALAQVLRSTSTREHTVPLWIAKTPL